MRRLCNQGKWGRKRKQFKWTGWRNYLRMQHLLTSQSFAKARSVWFPVTSCFQLTVSRASGGLSEGAPWPVGVGSSSWPGLSSSSPSSVDSPADQGTRRCLAMNRLVVMTVLTAIPYFERSIHETEVYVIGTKNYNLLGFQLREKKIKETNLQTL